MKIKNDLQNINFEKVYKVNKQLETEIFNGIPDDFSALEQSIYIYYNLCKKLNYSIDYYLNENENMHKFTTVEYIENIDGKTNKDVVCYTFDRIFMRMLFDKGLISKQEFWDNEEYIIDDGVFPPLHNKISINIDGVSYSIDATMGVFKDCDLTLSKFADFNMTGWQVIGEGYFSKQQENLEIALKRVQNFVDGKFKSAVNEYTTLKKENGEWKDYSIDIRANMFLSLINNNIKESNIDSLAYVYKLKRQIFDDDELSESVISAKKALVHFMFNTKTEGVSIIFAFSNLNKIKAYQIDLLTKKNQYHEIIKRTSFEEIMDKYHDDILKDISSSQPLERPITLMRQIAQYYAPDRVKNF